MAAHAPGWLHSTVELLRCTHLEASLTVTAVGTALAVEAGRGASAALVAASLLAGQFSIGWSNDWLDARRDLAVGRGDKPVVRGTVGRDTLRHAALGALAWCVVLSLASGLIAGTVHLAAVALAWGYNLGLKATSASVIPYAGAFGLLPVFAWLAGPGGRLPPAWIVVTGALLGAGAHFTNALPDLAEDARTGVRGLPQRLGASGALVAATVLLAGATVTVALGTAGDRGRALTVALGTSVAAIAAVPVVTLRGAPRAAFRLTMLAAVAVVAAFLLGAGE
jgi:4-hydroxybenzoate polyprenyltransferase